MTPAIDVIHENDDLLVLNKPANVALLADRSGAPCYWDALKQALGDRQPYLVHRLDKGTSGVLLVALRQEVQRELTRAFQQSTVRKFYVAWVVGSLALSSTHTIDLPLRRGRKSRFRVAGPREHIRRQGQRWCLTEPDTDGHAAITRLRTLSEGDGRSLLLLAPRTGRSHQLRVHLSWVGYPIVGDHLYGRPADPLQRADRLQLHCHRLVVPVYGTFRAPVGRDWLGHPAEGEGD
ncbi:MAG: RNA pseudouridine synthase [Pseudomonadales bacterium]|nr:RNA pseudouridine synthase [Pseudomonadales bacterium]NIX08934.1 RNA pseudouridine synthase [Pseudomonadales bacterium]